MGASGERVEVPLADGASLHAELFMAAGAGPHPGVVVLHESFGLNDDIRSIAARFADAGYASLAPSLFSHGPKALCVARVMADLVRGNVGREMGDILAARAGLAAFDRVDGERIAVAGFCLGGGFALVAATHPGFAAAAVNYGEVPATRSRLEGACPVVASFGERDRLFGRRTAERLESHLTALEVPHDVKTYAGVGHSFLSDVPRAVGGWQGRLAQLPSPLSVGYDEPAAEDAWKRTLAFFDEHVRP